MDMYASGEWRLPKLPPGTEYDPEHPAIDYVPPVGDFSAAREWLNPLPPHFTPCKWKITTKHEKLVVVRLEGSVCAKDAERLTDVVIDECQRKQRREGRVVLVVDMKRVDYADIAGVYWSYRKFANQYEGSKPRAVKLLKGVCFLVPRGEEGEHVRTAVGLGTAMRVTVEDEDLKRVAFKTTNSNSDVEKFISRARARNAGHRRSRRSERRR